MLTILSHCSKFFKKERVPSILVFARPYSRTGNYFYECLSFKITSNITMCQTLLILIKCTEKFIGSIKQENTPVILLVLNQWFPTFWVQSPGILFNKQIWSHVATKLSEIYHFGNFSGPTCTFFKSWYGDRSGWLGTSVLNDHLYNIQRD